MRRSTQPVQGRHTETGQAAVEFVLTILFIMFLIFSALDLIMMIYSYSVMADAAKEGVRYAIVHGSGSSLPDGPSTGTTSSCPAGTTTATVVQNYAKLTFHDVSSMTVNVCYLDGNDQSPNRVQVKVSYAYKSYFTLGWKLPTINAAAEGRIVF